MEMIGWVPLLATALVVGVIHTLAGPDHTVPFVAMARAGNWPLRKTLTVTFLCGLGHIGGSLVLAAAGAAFGWSLGRVAALDALRGDGAGWLLAGFGLVYAAWGLYRSRRGHSGHEHAADSMTPWVLFVIFAFGPCEALLPLVVLPAIQGSWVGLTSIVLVFSAATVGTMLVVVWLGWAGLKRFGSPRWERYTHAVAGLSVALCGLAICMGL